MTSAPTRYLITAGPTHEPIDSVRFIGNRSSGKLGIALARAAGARGHPVTLLLGPTGSELGDLPPGVSVRRFGSASDLQSLLGEHAPKADVVVMAAAVADYRPKVSHPDSKIRRTDAGMTLELEGTPDLLAELATRRHEGQRLIGFALEPRERLLESARAKLQRKKVDAIVANELETMDADTIVATVLTNDGVIETPGRLTKDAFAPWLLDLIASL